MVHLYAIREGEICVALFRGVQFKNGVVGKRLLLWWVDFYEVEGGFIER